MKQSKNTQQPVVTHHYARTIIAALFGILALGLIFASVIVAWMNRTLTDTSTYVNTVAPLVAKPEVQDYFSNKVSEEIYKNAPTQDVAAALLPAAEITGKTPDQLKAASQVIIKSSIKQVLSSVSFQKLWTETNRTAHQQLLKQIKSNDAVIILDLSPTLSGLSQQLQQTRLAPIVSQLSLTPDKATLKIQGEAIKNVHNTYKQFQRDTIILLLVALLATILSVVISVHHAKTLRRIALGTGIGLLGLALLIQVGSLIKFSGPDAETKIVSAVLARTLLHNLQVVSLVIGLVLVVAALSSKLYTKLKK